jgi:hypothetical protein
MTTQTNTENRKQIDTGYETFTFALGLGITSAALLGTWACACMTSAILNNGIVEVVKGLFGAIA